MAQPFARIVFAVLLGAVAGVGVLVVGAWIAVELLDGRTEIPW